MRSRNRGGGGTNEGRKEGRRRGIKYWCMDQVHVYALMFDVTWTWDLGAGAERVIEDRGVNSQNLTTKGLGCL